MKRRSRARVLLARWVFVGLVGIGSGCHGPPRALPDGGASPAEIPTPEGLLIKVAVRDPDAMWGRLQRGAGGALALLPPEVGAIAASMLGPDVPFAADIDGHATSYAAVVARRDSTDAVAWSLAMPLAGEGTARGDAGGAGVWAREPGWLVVASDAAALASIGPYVTHRLPSDASLASGAPVNAVMPAAAVDGFVASAASERWAGARAWLRERARTEREAHGGRAPDFGDPDAIVDLIDGAVVAGLARLAQAGDVRIEGDAGDGDVALEVTTPVTPDDAGVSGDATPLASVGGDAAIALLLRSGMDDRVARARDASDAVARVFRIEDDPSRAAVSAAFDGWARAQGDWVTLAPLPAGDARAFMVRTPSESAVASRRAAHDVLALARLPAIRRLLRGWLDLRLARFGATATEGEAVFADRSGPSGRAPAVAWTVADGQLSLAAGNDPHGLLEAPLGPLDARAAGLVAGVGDGVTFAVLAQPLRLGRLGALGRSAPVLVAGGRRGATAWLRVDLADAILTEGVRLGGGLF
jgi:hypothetical protein